MARIPFGRLPRTRSLARVLGVACGAFAFAVVLCPTHAQAIHSSQALDRVVRYLENDQNTDGGFGGEPGEKSSPGFTAWVALALAAAGVNPRDQEREGHDAFSYLVANADQMSATTDFERELLVVDASGTSPRDFGGIDLVGQLLARELPEPSQSGVAFSHEAGPNVPGMNDTIFAVIALSPIHEPVVEAAVQQATTWIEHEQNHDGSWPSTCPRSVAGCSPFGKEPEGEADMTAAAIEALNAAGRQNTAAQERGLEYLHRTQNPCEGGFAEQLGSHSSDADCSLEANVGSTAWVAQAIWAAGQEPQTWSPQGADPLTYMESMQQPDGHVSWRRGQEMNGVWMTAYSGPALAGVPLPVPAPPYEPPQAPGSGAGVTSGGGGNGAPLFSRPQARSRGRNPGGPKTNRASPKRTRRRDPGPVRRHLPEGPGPARTGGGLAAPAPPHAGPRTAKDEISGIPIGTPVAYKHAAEPGAPGLKSAGDPSGPIWPALLIAGLAAGLALTGSAIERRRPAPLS